MLLYTIVMYWDVLKYVQFYVSTILLNGVLMVFKFKYVIQFSSAILVK